MDVVKKSDFIFFKNEILEDLKRFENKLNNKILLNSNTILEQGKKNKEEISNVKNKIFEMMNSSSNNEEKIEIKSKLTQYKTKIDEFIFVYNTKINSLEKQINDMGFKYDKIFINNLIIPGLIGNSCPFSTAKLFFEYVNKKLKDLSYDKDIINKNNKLNKDKLESLIKQFQMQIDLAESKFSFFRNEFSKKFEQKSEQKLAEIEERIDKLRLENGAHSFELKKITEDLNIELDKIKEVKNDLSNKFDIALNNLKKEEKNFKREMNIFKNEIKLWKSKYNDMNGNLKDNSFRNNISSMTFRKKIDNHFSDKLLFNQRPKYEEDNFKVNSIDTDRNNQNNNNLKKILELNNSNESSEINEEKNKNNNNDIIDKKDKLKPDDSNKNILTSNNENIDSQTKNETNIKNDNSSKEIKTENKNYNQPKNIIKDVKDANNNINNQKANLKIRKSEFIIKEKNKILQNKKNKIVNQNSLDNTFLKFNKTEKEEMNKTYNYKFIKSQENTPRIINIPSTPITKLKNKDNHILNNITNEINYNSDHNSSDYSPLIPELIIKNYKNISKKNREINTNIKSIKIKNMRNKKYFVNKKLLSDDFYLNDIHIKESKKDNNSNRVIKSNENEKLDNEQYLNKDEFYNHQKETKEIINGLYKNINHKISKITNQIKNLTAEIFKYYFNNKLKTKYCSNVNISNNHLKNQSTNKGMNFSTKDNENKRKLNLKFLSEVNNHLSLSEEQKLNSKELLKKMDSFLIKKFQEP